jgi:hypothetical protein
MDSNDDLESDSDSGADITPLSDSETELRFPVRTLLEPEFKL